MAVGLVTDGTTLYVMRYMQNHHVHKTLRGMKIIITLDKYMIKGKRLSKLLMQQAVILNNCRI